MTGRILLLLLFVTPIRPQPSDPSSKLGHSLLLCEQPPEVQPTVDKELAPGGPVLRAKDSNVSRCLSVWPQAHARLTASGTPIPCRKSASPIFLVRIWLKTELSALCSPSCRSRTLLSGGCWTASDALRTAALHLSPHRKNTTQAALSTESFVRCNRSLIH
jgi:hypothetical protein